MRRWAKVSTIGLLSTFTLAAMLYWKSGTFYGANGLVVRKIEGCSMELREDQPARVKSLLRDGNELVFVVVANDNCSAADVRNPTFTVSGSVATFEWQWHRRPGVEPTACNCTKHLEVRQPNVPLSVKEVKVGGHVLQGYLPVAK